MAQIPYVVSAEASSANDLDVLALVPTQANGTLKLKKDPAAGSWVALTSVAAIAKALPGYIVVGPPNATRAQKSRIVLTDHPDGP